MENELDGVPAREGIERVEVREVRERGSAEVAEAGFKVRTVGSGAEALAVITDVEPQLITVDIGLPDMDGRDLTRSLRRRTSAPIMIITARAGEDAELDSMSVGASAYLNKPFHTSDVQALIQRLCA